ncbi:serine hydrolase [Muricauda sp. TY007]|uniref:serine hydrolase domain-containing protein n=1 Tax=Allomuricauda sp. TY007 TaxID=2683200 RepID=UPI0013C09C2B|nr:serine hydrolase [Muricauda sp. TY007]NDV16958.1 serine hydrolase [Muricauda sp. TY007]
MRLLFLLILLLITYACGTSKDVSPENASKFKEKHPSFSTQFANKVEDIYLEKGMYGDFIFAVVDENGLAYSFTLNREILKGEESSLDNDTPIYIASSTKSFTGTLLKILEQENVLDLNNSLQEYLPKLNYSDSIETQNIAIKNLLNHTHGTFSTSMTWKTAFLGFSGGNDELIEDLNNDFLYDPSGNYRYSNVGPIISGMVAEEMTGKTWKALMNEHIFTPLQMENTSTNVSDFIFKDIRPSLTVTKERGIIEKGFYKSDITMHASGGIISTINDLSKWLAANIDQDNVLLNDTSWGKLHTSTTNQDKNYFTYHRSGYSLGWDIAEYQNNKMLTRFGGLAGISFHISFMPDKKVGIIAFSNDNRAYLLPHLMANYAYNLINELPADNIFKSEKTLFNKSFEREDDIPYPDDSQILAVNTLNDAIMGTYHNAENWPTIEIHKEGDHYVFNWGILKGKIFRNDQGGYTSNLGVLSRNFHIKGNSLSTGSLIYKK